MSFFRVAVTCFALSFSCVGFGEATIPFADSSYFQQLVRLFDLGDAPMRSDVAGWWTGHCFKADQPSRAFGMVLVAKSVEDPSSNRGTNFPDTTMDEFAVALAQIHPIEISDYNDISLAEERSIDDYLASGRLSASTVTVASGSLLSKDFDGHTAYRVRKFGNQLIAEVTPVADYEGKKAGTVYVACSFSKKIHN